MTTDWEAIGHVKASSEKQYQQFVLFGDSLTQESCHQIFGLTPALQDAYIRRLDIVNRGFSGYTTRNALWAIPGFMPRPEQARIRLMIIFFGANDACLPGYTQHVPLDLYQRSLKELCLHPTVTAHDAQVLLVTPPPVNEYQLMIKAMKSGTVLPARTAANTRRYAEGCIHVGKELGIPVVDIWRAFMTRAGWEEGEPLPGSRETEPSDVLEGLLSDGLHFRPEGYRLMFNTVMDLIRAELPDHAPENLPMLYPHWMSAPKAPE